jgi:hypothetical protein
MDNKTWTSISTLKAPGTSQWESKPTGLNSFLSTLPWHALDNPIQQDCLLYNVDSAGTLHLLAIVYVIRLTTTPTSRTVLYKYDKQHARLHTYRVCKKRWSMVGIMEIHVL